MAAGGFDLKKWASNVSEVVAHLPESDREVKVPIELNANDPIQALGIDWNTATDSFGFKSTLDPNDNKPFAKRSALSTELFDPIGLIAPIIVIAKIFMKKVWATTLDWDDSLPSILRNIEGLQHISEIKIPRWINTGKGNKSIQIHGFRDASEMAYGAALYIRTIDQNNEVHVHLISSKSKVSPKKALTMPRLELCGAHLLSSLLSSIRRGFRHASISSEDIVLWCYSEIVCYWLRNTKPLKVFVANRVSKINELTEGIRWSHVRTHDNPADLVSRGISPKELANNSLWWHGPSWLLLPSEEWPTSRIDIELPTPPENIDLEIRRVIQANVCIQPTDIVQRFSDYDRLLRVSAHVQPNRRQVDTRRPESSTKALDYLDAKTILFRRIEMLPTTPT